jgi:uncharacterized protein (TIGR03084 family)
MAAEPSRGHSDVPAHFVVNNIVQPTTNDTRLDGVRHDLADEQHALDDIVAHITSEQFQLPTPSPGWSVADQIGHLTFFDAAAACAISDPERFANRAHELYEGAVAHGIDEYTLGAFRSLSPSEQLASWRHNRMALLETSRSLHEGDRVAWYGPSMGAVSFLTARLMETWAHGVDVADALGVSHSSSDRLQHVARLGFMTRKWSYAVRGEDLPEGEVRVALTSPSGKQWTWGDEGAIETVRGSAHDFCLVVTQRRHVDDTSLATSDLGRHWLLRAQAFAGAPSDGPQARSS